MEFTVYEKPCLLLETAELVYAFVNHLPAKSLTRSGPHCISTEAAEEMLKEVCASLSAEDDELRFYFEGTPIEGESERMSCLAYTLICSCLPVDHVAVDDAIQALHSVWFKHERNFTIEGINGYSLSLIHSTHYTSFAQQILKLPISTLYQAKLIEVFSGFDWHVERVGKILQPLAQRLQPLLEPWIKQAAPLITAWQHFLSTPESEDIVQKKMNFIKDDIKEVRLALRYFSPQCGLGNFSYGPNIMRLHMGVAITPGQPSIQNTPPEDWELAAMRLLASSDRITMLNAMLREPMSGPALMKKFGFHSGSVFRDLNSLYNAGLLSICVQDGKNTYRTNFPVIQKLATRMLQAIDPDYKP